MDQQVAQSETLEQIAERIANSIPQRAKQAFGREQVKDDILSALRNERERAAKVAERMRPSGGRLWTDEQSACFEALTECAKAIRQGR